MKHTATPCNTPGQRATARRIIARAKRGDRVFVTDPRGGTIAGRVTLKHEASLVIQPERDRWARPIRATELNLV
ncbi:MAG: hypothetical protein ACJ768_19570 [Gaiellaceae bacterium]